MKNKVIYHSKSWLFEPSYRSNVKLGPNTWNKIYLLATVVYQRKEDEKRIETKGRSHLNTNNGKINDSGTFLRMSRTILI